MNKHKNAISDGYNVLDVASESRNLTSIGKERMKQIAAKLGEIWALEGLKIGRGLEIEIY